MAVPGRSSSTQRAGEILGRVRTLAQAILTDQGMELVDVEFRREAPGWVLRLYVDRPGGVTLDDCQRVSEELGDHLDVENFIDHPYHLEVSSPGLDRPLIRDADFVRFAGHEVNLRTHEAVEGQRNFRGRLTGLEGERVLLELSDGRHVAIPRELILKARLRPEF
jgi:ribosome maturation factor RimP